jgi:8-oxo-dGTP diphosphatase
MSQTYGLIVSALVRRDTDLLMVREPLPGDHEPSWVLPGGVVEPGELVHEALIREVREETGLIVPGPSRMLFLCQYTVTDDEAWAGGWTVFTFEVDLALTEQQLVVADPDRLVLEAAWVPLPEAMRRLSRIKFSPRREPLLRHLRGCISDTTHTPQLWLWPDGTDADPMLVPVTSHMDGAGRSPSKA